MARIQVFAVFVFALLLSTACVAYGQESGGSVFLAHQEVRVADLPALAAPSKNRSDVLATALAIVVHDKTVCCGKDSALADAVAYAELSNPASLEDLRTRLQGKHRGSDGPPVVVDAQYIPESAITGDAIVRSLLMQHAQIIEWKARIYVLYGALYNEDRDYSGTRAFSVEKLFLVDPRFSDEQKGREVVFNRETDDLKTVQGMLAVTFTVPPSPWK